MKKLMRLLDLTGVMVFRLSDVEKLEGYLRSLIRGKKYIVMCVGNVLRRDDGVGSYVGSKLLDYGLQDVVINCEMCPENYIGKLLSIDVDLVLVIDALLDERYSVGTVIVTKLPTAVEDLIPVTTHTIPLNYLVNVVKMFKSDTEFYLLGIVVRDLEFGEGLSPEVHQVAEKLIKVLKKVLSEHG
ncbi:MAG: hypothetical protein DRJ40_04125 [Thermoprotei archaeon]|nr:MAG: hypothetical protein DRJ40_04125 [Thermoprotei archaeon]